MEPTEQDPDSQLSVEERRVRLDETRLDLENSFAKKWLPTLVTLMAGLIAGMFSAVQWINASYTNERTRIEERAAAERASMDANIRNEREWGFKAVEMYFSKRELFDVTKNPEQAGRNLSVLAAIAPTSVGAVLSVEKSRIPTPGGADDSKRLDSLAAVAEVQNALASARQLPPASSKPADFTIYVQYPEGGLELALKTQDLLVQLGYRVPGIEQVANTPSEFQVRYYRPEQRDDAEELAMQLGRDLRIPRGTATPLRSSKELPSGILEVWLP